MDSDDETEDETRDIVGETWTDEQWARFAQFLKDRAATLGRELTPAEIEGWRKIYGITFGGEDAAGLTPDEEEGGEGPDAGAPAG